MSKALYLPRAHRARGYDSDQAFAPHSDIALEGAALQVDLKNCSIERGGAGGEWDGG